MRKHEPKRDHRAPGKAGRPEVNVELAGPHQRVLRLQRLAGNAAVADLLAPDRVVPRGGGRPLEPSVRREMEAKLGHDFSAVRLHEDAADAMVAGRRLRLGHSSHIPDGGGPQTSSSASTRAQSVQRASRRPEEDENRFPRTQILGPLGPMSALGATNFFDVPSFEDLKKEQPGFTLSMPKASKYFGLGGPPPIRQEESGVPEHILRQGRGFMLKLNLLPSPVSSVDPSARENQPGPNKYLWQMMQEQAK